ncbi:MAG: sigma-70 family RNA polymerase sigma factor [Salinibacterium sp.]|nr:sigma-70 family RNA polymerase sigma factor [Salinibacterium sp.]
MRALTVRTVVPFEEFVRTDGERLRRVMAAQYGIDIGADAANAALAWAWEEWERVSQMKNAAGYLYRVAQTHARRDRQSGRRVSYPPETATGRQVDVALDDDLRSALLELTEQQRTAVLMVHAYGWTPTELAEITGSRPATVRSHLRRGLRELRTMLTEGND